MTMITTRSRWFQIAVVALLALGAAGGAAHAQVTDRSFGWFVDVVSVDQSSGTVTVRAPALPHVANYIGEFASGDPVALVWTQFDGEADAIIYVERPDVMKTPGGYVVYGKFIAADPAGDALTFAVPAEPDALRSLAAAPPGTPVRIESPFSQPDAVTMVASVALNEKPAPRPVEEAEEEIARKPDGPLVDVSGRWMLEASLMDNPITTQCTLTQERETLSGNCEAMGQPIPLTTGTVAGNTVRFTIASSFADTEVSFTYNGAVDPTGARMSGEVSVMGFGSGFKGTKQP